jgi:hypothetical protein
MLNDLDLPEKFAAALAGQLQSLITDDELRALKLENTALINA